MFSYKSLFLFHHSVLFNSFWSHGLQHSRLPCISLPPAACSSSCPLYQWCHPTISPSVAPFSSRLQSFPESGSFPMSWLFVLRGQSIGASTSASVLPRNTQGWFPLGDDWLDLFAVQGILKSLLQHHSSKASVLWCSVFFMVQLSNWYMITGETRALALTIWTFCQQSDGSAF